mmetsp:Transcript_43069/g.104241  ORF Transcript_43069/g.104241 Transcript_43069/m.104241 type:complete len:235 (-) Transcript_43069:585-1289(-)
MTPLTLVDGWKNQDRHVRITNATIPLSVLVAEWPLDAGSVMTNVPSCPCPLASAARRKTIIVPVAAALRIIIIFIESIGPIQLKAANNGSSNDDPCPWALRRKKHIMKLIALRFMKSSVGYVIPGSLVKQIFASTVTLSLVPTIVIYVICGCPMTSPPITVRNVDFVEWVEGKTFGTVTIVACALIGYSLMITIARLESTCPIVPSVKKISLVPGMPRTKCHVDMPFIGTVSRN